MRYQETQVVRVFPDGSLTSEIAQSFGDELDVDVGRCHLENEVVHVVVRCLRDVGAVDVEEDGCRKPSQSPVSGDKGMVVDDGVKQSRGLLEESG